MLRLLEKQEDILYEEDDKFINVQKSLALESKKNELLSSELSACNDSISNLKNLNVDLIAKLEKVNIASSYVEHVVMCNRCKDFDIDACNEHVSTIFNLNNDVACAGGLGEIPPGHRGRSAPRPAGKGRTDAGTCRMQRPR